MGYTGEDSGAARMLDEQRQLWIEAFRHARHDWLNDLQMIMGYVQLQKYDKLKACVDMLKQRMTIESRTSSLGSAGLIEALLTVRAKARSFAFELRIEEEFRLRGGEGTAEAAELAVRRLLDAFEASAERGEAGSDNALACTFANEREDTRIVFEYRGAYHSGKLRHAVELLRGTLEGAPPACSVTDTYGADTARVELRLPQAT